MDIKEELNKRIAALQTESLTNKNNLEAFEKAQESRIDGIFKEFLSVVDTFDRAEKTIKERGLDQEENAKKAINRLLNAKKKALSVLEKFDVKKIEFEDGHSIPELCSVADTEPDPDKKSGDIISIEREGYTRKGKLLRAAEVVIVKN
jgi:molecular chaperone GrpE (heat shock protein)